MYKPEILSNSFHSIDKRLSNYLLKKKKLLYEFLSLNEKQRKAYNLIIKDNVTNLYITGSPGSGKTYLAGVIARALNTTSMAALAPSHKAKKVLSESLNMNCQTIHRFTGYVLDDNDSISVDDSGDLLKQKETDYARVLIVDEVSMVPDYLFQDAIDNCEIVIALGDDNQLEAIGEPNAQLDNFERIELTEQMRQDSTDSELYKTIQLLKQSIESGIHSSSKMKFDDTLIQSGSLVNNFLNNEIDVIGVYTNDAVKEYNELIQYELYRTTEIIPGNTLILQKPMMDLIKTSNGRLKNAIVLNNGDSIVIENVTKDNFGNRIVSIEGYGLKMILSEKYSKYGGMWELFQEHYGRKSTWKEFKSFVISAKLPYAMTIHKLQGSTYENVGIDVTNIVSIRKGKDIEQKRRLMYVGMSRAKKRCYII